MSRTHVNCETSVGVLASACLDSTILAKHRRTRIDNVLEWHNTDIVLLLPVHQDMILCNLKLIGSKCVSVHKLVDVVGGDYSSCLHKDNLRSCF